MSEIRSTSEHLMNKDQIENAIAYARGQGEGSYLARLTDVQKDVAELGARRAIAYLKGERVRELQPGPAVPCGAPHPSDYVRTTFGPKFFSDVGTDPEKWFRA